MVWFILILIVLVLLFYMSKRTPNNLIESFRVDNFFEPTITYIDALKKKAISFDEDSRLIAFLDENGETHYYDSNNIISSEVEIGKSKYENHPIINTYRNYYIGKLIGGQKIGEIAAKTSRVVIYEDITSIDLKITVNDIANPIFKIQFLKGKFSKNKQKESIEEAERWNAIIKILRNEN